MTLYGSIVSDCFKDCVNDYTSENLSNSEVPHPINPQFTLFVEGLFEKVYGKVHQAYQ